MILCLYREGSYKIQATSAEVFEEFFPLLADFLIEAQLREEDEDVPEEEYELDPQLQGQLSKMIRKDAAVRKVALAFCLVRCHVADYVSTVKMLKAISIAMEGSSLKDEVAFCRTFCKMITERLQV